MKLKQLSVAIFLLFTLTLPVFAHDTPVTDYAQLFSQSEYDNLTASAQAMADEVDGDVIIITTNESFSGSRDLIIEDYCDNMGYDDNAILLHIDMMAREVWVQTFGTFDSTISTSDKDELYYQVRDYLSDGDYYGGASHFIETVPATLDGSIGTDLSFIELVIVIPIALLIFCGIFFGVTLSYGSEGKARPYSVKERASTQLRVSEDRFIREYTTSVRIKSDNNNGGGASHSSGGSSSSSGGGF